MKDFRTLIQDIETQQDFYVYPDCFQKEYKLPQTLDDAYGNGFLVISRYQNQYYLMIENQEYFGTLSQMEEILYSWAMSENYIFTQ